MSAEESPYVTVTQLLAGGKWLVSLMVYSPLDQTHTAKEVLRKCKDKTEAMRMAHKLAKERGLDVRT